MTLDQIASSLPNGFHDAELAGYSVSYVTGTAHMELSIWTGSPSDMETYRSASLILNGLYFWIIEPPDARYDHTARQKLTIDVGRVADLKTAPSVQLPPLPKGVVAFWIYVRQWNAFMYFAAQSADFQWRGTDKKRVP